MRALLRTRLLNHLPYRHSSGDHRVDVLFLLDHEVDDCRAVKGHRFHDRGPDLGLVGNASPISPKSLGQLDEVRISTVAGCNIGAFVEDLLPLPHHPEEVIVQNGYLDRDALFSTMVAISHMVIWNPPSPATDQTTLSGRPTCAPIAPGTS